MVENKEFLKWLVTQKFDLAFSHIYDVCPIGLIHYAKIPSWIWLNRSDCGTRLSDFVASAAVLIFIYFSGGLMDFVAHYIGVPTIPSFNPRALFLFNIASIVLVS